MPQLYKSAMCYYYCVMGAKCTYAHSRVELRSPTGSCGSSSARSRFKTELCVFHPEGRCRKGDSCEYAHGVEELRD